MGAARTAVVVSALALFGWWALADGGYAPGAWYPGALLVLGALIAVARPRLWRSLPRPGRWALAALAAFAAWSLLSISWADSRGDAWDGANRTLLYLTVFALFALLPWTPRAAARWLGAFALVTAAIGCWTVGRALAGAAPEAFADGRLAGPIGYENASAALFLCAFWAALLLAARPGSPPRARAVLLAGAGVLVELTILSQSRGSLIAGAVTLVLAFALVAERRSLAVALVAVAAVAGASLPALLGVYEQASAGAEPDLWPAALVLGGSALVLLALSPALGPVERWAAERARLPHPRVLAAGAVLLAAAAAGVVFAGGPLTAAGGAADSRFTAGPGSGRYDFWRVAALEFAHHPVTGVGADNFTHDYVRDRRHGEEPLYPHSLALRAFAQTGIVGAALLAAFLAAAAFAALRSRDAARRPVAVAALVAAAAWLAHGSIDWLWEVPAVAAPALACLGIAVGVAPRGSSTAPGARRVAVPAAAAVLAVAAAASYALPALAAREVEQAGREWAGDPATALRSLARARDLNPLSDRPDLVAGALARAAGDREGARRSFLAALDRDGRNWHAHVEVALLDFEAGRRSAAVTRLERAQALNPGEELIAEALTSARAGDAPSTLLRARLADRSLPGPIERHGTDCRPLLGIGQHCGEGRG